MFKHLGVNQGLSNNQVNAVYKDSRGNMWFGTSSGLNRFDGFHFKTFVNKIDDPTSLPDSFIEEIQELEDGSLLLKTLSGYARMLRDTQTFEGRQQLQERWRLPAKPEIVKIDSYKNVWCYVPEEGIFLYRPSDKSSFQFSQGKEGHLLPEGKIATIAECSEGVILGYENGLLVGLNSLRKNVSFIDRHIYDHHYDGVFYFQPMEDRRQNLWVVSPGGLHIYIHAEDRWYDSLKGLGLKMHTPIQITDDLIKCITKDDDGNVWLGTDRQGLFKIDLDERTIWNFQADPDDSRSLSGNSIQSVYIDRDDVLWVGTYKDGVNYYGASIFKFKELNFKDVTSITQSSDGEFCFSSSNGVYFYDPKTDTRLHYQEGDRGLLTNVIVCSMRSRSGDLWFGTFRKGLAYFRDGRFHTLRHKEGDPSTLANDDIWALAEDRNGYIWIGTLGCGVQCLDPRTNRVVKTYTKKDGLPNNYIMSLSITHDDKLLVGTSQGLSILDLRTHKMELLKGNRRGSQHFTSSDIVHAYEDSRGLIWLATRQGLNVWDPLTDNLYTFPQEVALQNQLITAVVEDKKHHIWVTGSNGAVNVLVNEMDGDRSYSFQVIYYDERDGLQGQEFNRRSIFCSQDGSVMMGGPYGLNYVNPDHIQFNQILPNVFISSLYLFNEEVKIGEVYDGHVILPADINELNTLTLNYTQNVITFLLGSDNFSLSEKMSFRYKLDGFNESWLIGEPAQSRITYTNLAPGTYTLRVKAVNGDGYVSEKERLLTIIIKPPFWLSRIAWGFYILLAVVGCYAVLRYVKSNRRLRLKLKKLEKVYAEKRELERMLADSVNRYTQIEEAVSAGSSQAVVKDGEVQPTVLIVDDNEDYLSLLRSCLQKRYRVFCAHDGVEALDFIHRDMPSLMICDNQTPRMTGNDLYQIVKEESRTSRIPVIMLIAPLDNAVSLDTFRFGMDDYVTKPFDVDELLLRMEHLLQVAGRRRGEEQAYIGALTNIPPEGWLWRMVCLVEEHLSDYSFSVEKFSLMASVPRLQLYEKIIEGTGMSPLEFILCIRLRRAGELLQEGVLSISEIACQTGYHNLNSFTRSFREVYGMMPSVYRELKEKSNEVT